MTGAQAAGQPWFLMLNSHDPHRPFVGNDPAEWYQSAKGQPPAVPPSATFSADQVTVPGHLTDLPEVRQEIAEYYGSVRRCDDTIGAALAELERAGCADNTIVLFLSDNGMAFPFAKTNCYLHSTRTPFLVRWPQVVAPGGWDREHFVSGIDLMPTLLDVAGAELPEDLDGTSFLPVLRGEAQAGRERVFTQFYQTAARNNYPMRCVQNRRCGYIWNPWSNGERIFRNESQAGRTFAAMQAAAEADERIAARVELFLHRVPEELYDFARDPNALVNVIDDPAYAQERRELQQALEAWMAATGDPALEAYRQRHDPAARESVMAATAERIGGKS